MNHIPLADIHTFTLDAGSAEPMYRQLYFAIRNAILQGQLVGGTRLPSSRQLASSLSVSRQTVTTAYEQLWAEGFIAGRTGSGSYVSEKLPDRLMQAKNIAGRAVTEHKNRRRLSARGEMVAGLGKPPAGRPLPFCPGLPDLAVFPGDVWARLYARHWRQATAAMLAYTDPAGYLPLREAVADYLRTCRAVRCMSDQVIIMAGTQQALDLCARMLLDPGDTVWLEEPGYHGARGAFQAAGAHIAPIVTDDQGIRVAEGIKRAGKAAAVYVTPSHQYPGGSTLSLARRLELLAWAGNNNAWIIEDDYDSEYRYGGKPLSSLQGLDSYGRVLYTGTFSKVLFPSLRLAYLVVPSDLVAPFLQARTLMDSHPPTIPQAALADFIVRGYFASHIRRTRILYEQRREIFLKAARKKLSRYFDVEASLAGMHAVAYAKHTFADREFVRRAAREGLESRALSSYYLNPDYARSGLVLGYAGFSESRIEDGIEKLLKLIKN